VPLLQSSAFRVSATGQHVFHEPGFTGNAVFDFDFFAFTMPPKLSLTYQFIIYCFLFFKTIITLYELRMIDRYIGIPKVILNGKVTAKAMGRYKPGLAFGAAIFMAAGTAI
jgi:hypothetical protein